MSYKYSIPSTVQLWWKCITCDSLHRYPETRARIYCSQACMYRHHYLKQKNKKISTE